MNMQKKIFITFLFLLGLCTQAQQYRHQFLDFDAQVSCAQNVTNYGDDFDIEILTIGNSPRGYKIIEIGQATEDGFECTDYNEFDVNLTASQSLCGSFTEAAGGCCTDWDFIFRIIPNNFQILTPDPGANNTVASITLEASPGYDPLVYRWQFFHPDTNQWTLLPAAFQGQSSITFDAADLFGASAANYYGVSIQYRLELCNGWVPDEFTTPYTYVFIKESPQVVSVNANPTTCSYSSDGEFTITFNRPLDAGEELTNLSLQWAGLDNILDTADDVPVFDAVASATYSGTTFTWPNPLDAGVYRIRYQSDSANTLEIYDPILITSPSAVNFNATWTDIDCFGENTGSISISANGGVGGFEYRLNSGSWNNFSGVNNHNESNLTAGNYAVRVRDANGCTERE